MRRFAMIVVSALLLPAANFAQHASGGMAMGFHGAPVMARPVIARPMAARPVTRSAAGTRLRTGTRIASSRSLPGTAHSVHRGSANSPREGDAFASDFNFNNGPGSNSSLFEPFPGEFSVNNVPGLGFDFPHMAAVSGNQFANFGGPAGFGGFGTPFGFGGFMLSSPVIVETGVPAEQPPADETASNGTDNQETEQQNQHPGEAEALRYAYEAGRAESSNASAPGPSVETDSRQYVFVRRDGGLVFAVAYSWDNDNLRYVTPDGIRRSISSGSLDLDATRQFNEQRGLNFHLPA